MGVVIPNHQIVPSLQRNHLHTVLKAITVNTEPFPLHFQAHPVQKYQMIVNPALRYGMIVPMMTQTHLRCSTLLMTQILPFYHFFQLCYHVSDKALSHLLFFLHFCIISVLVSIILHKVTLANSFPTTLYSLRKHLKKRPPTLLTLFVHSAKVCIKNHSVLQSLIHRWWSHLSVSILNFLTIDSRHTRRNVVQNS